MNSFISKYNLRLPPTGLILQLFAIILLPLTLLLVGITFGSLSIHQHAMRSLVGERDERAVSIAASALNAQLDFRAKELGNIMFALSGYSSQPTSAVLAKIGGLTSNFEAGVAVFDLHGKLVANLGNENFWETWVSDSAFLPVEFPRLLSPTNSYIVVPDPSTGEFISLISAKMNTNYLVAGGFYVRKLADTTLSDITSSSGDLSILLVSADHQILYNSGNLTDQSANHPGVDQALHGQSGITYVKVSGDEHVTAYSPVSFANWALVTEESWEAVATPTLRSSLIAPLILIPAVLIMVLALYLGASQVVRPLHILESKAATLAWGDFKSIQEPVGGIAEIQHLQKELILMSDKVRQAQRSLHSYIGAITNAQEDERRRLARELHDDTLQALIALKQRVQLAQYELESSPMKISSNPTQLDEIGLLTEQTIENLRRLTRDLRPVYLEDLGLVPALEMLAQETGQVMGIEVEFHQQGNEIRLDASIELALYRMAQEAMSNISRHAQAKWVAVYITFEPDSVRLRISDDGKGFTLLENAADYAGAGHYGLLGLYERAELIGANLDIRTSPEKGTDLIVSIPIHPQSSKE
jgi:signal transduction histidine kinase